MLKLPRTIRLDPSDTFVFARAAEPGEWAVSGAFVFWDCEDAAKLDTKSRVALRSGFLGLDSLGWSTLVVVAEATETDRAEAVERLAMQLVAQFGAPDLDAARASAEEEVAFAASLCDHPIQTLLAVRRSIEKGELHEEFRTLRPREPEIGGDPLHAHARAFTFREVEGEDEPIEEIDLLSLMKTEEK